MVRLVVRESAIAGKGCFALEDIPKGTLLGEYTGPIISFEEADDIYGEDEDTYLFSLEGNMCIDATHIEHDMKYVNHCCEPNCEATEEDSKVFYHAKKDIKAGEELTVDYQLISENEDKCFCGAEICRGTMRDVSDTTNQDSKILEMVVYK